MKKLLYILLLLSGFSALVYELVWTRKLSLVLGTDTYAIATIIAVFFAGLALGSFIFARLIDKNKNHPILLYGLLELGIGMYALFTPVLFVIIGRLQTVFWQVFEPTFGGFSLFSFVLLLGALSFPAVLMGGTLPVVYKFLAGEEKGAQAGLVYGINTLGAFLGVLAATFFLVERLGVNGSIFAAAVANLMVAAVAYLVYRNSVWRPKVEVSARTQSTGTFLLAIFFIAGLAAIALEVLWTRVLVTVVGASVYAFGIILGAFLVGIFLGSVVSARFADRQENKLFWLSLVEVLLGSLVILSIPYLGRSPLYFLEVYERFAKDFLGLQFGIFLLVSGSLFVPTFLMGVAFPLGVKAYEASTGRRIGEIYSMNTAGGVLGALLAGFLLIPVLGVQKSILASGTLFLLVGILLLYRSKKDKTAKLIPLGVAVLVFFLGWRVPSWDPALLSAGIYVNPQSFLVTDRRTLLANLGRDEILYEADGISAHVAVRRERDGNLNLRINGKADASTSFDMENQLLLGHLPLFFHKGAEEVLVIGLGSGITLGSVLSHPVQNVDVVEIEGKVVEAAEFFNQYSNNALADPRVNVIIADGRHFLRATGKKYDVISSEPSNPWLSGSSKLFTKEYFKLLKEGVREDGVVLHWINPYSLDLEGLKSVLGAFDEVFEHTVVFVMPASNDLAMIGAKRPLKLNPSRLVEALGQEAVRNDLKKVGIEQEFEILSYFVLDDEALERVVGGVAPNTDDRPVVEFSAPRALYEPAAVNPWRVVLDNLAEISEILPSSAGAQDTVQKAQEFRRARLLVQIHLVEGNIEEGIKEGEAALVADPDNPYLSETLARLYFEKGAIFLNQGDSGSARDSFLRSLELKETAATYVNLGLSYFSLGDLRKAEEAFEKAVAADPEFWQAYFELGEVRQKQGNLNEALEAFEKVVSLAPNNIEALVNLGNLYLLRADFSKAEEYAGRALKLDPANEDAKSLLNALP